MEIQGQIEGHIQARIYDARQRSRHFEHQLYDILPHWDKPVLDSVPKPSFLPLGLEWTAIYKHMDMLIIPVAGMTTGVPDLDFIHDLDPVANDLSFSQKLAAWTSTVNLKIGEYLEDKAWPKTKGIGPSRSMVFLSSVVAEAREGHGFAPHEKPLPYTINTFNNTVVKTYGTFGCGGQDIALIAAPQFYNPRSNSLPVDVGVQKPSATMRLHMSRGIYAGDRNRQEWNDVLNNFERRQDCLR